MSTGTGPGRRSRRADGTPHRGDGAATTSRLPGGVPVQRTGLVMLAAEAWRAVRATTRDTRRRHRSVRLRQRAARPRHVPSAVEERVILAPSRNELITERVDRPGGTVTRAARADRGTVLGQPPSSLPGTLPSAQPESGAERDDAEAAGQDQPVPASPPAVPPPPVAGPLLA